MKNKKNKIALVCTKGGHFEQLINLSDVYNQYNHFWITNRNNQTTSTLEKEKKYFVRIAHFKKPWTFLFQIPSMIRIFLKEKPTHILSTGSGRTAFIPYILARICNIYFIYIDTFSRVYGYSKFGTFLLKTGQNIFSQWEDPGNKNVTYIGCIFKKLINFQKTTDSDYIFVTVGTREEPFTRLITAVEALKKKGIIKEKIIVQAGYTKYRSHFMEIFDFCTPKKIEKLIMNAKYIITQESGGIGSLCLKYNTKFIVMPRIFKYGELPAKSDMKEDLQYKLQEMGYTKVVTDKTELENAIMDIDDIKTGFTFNNDFAVKMLIKHITTIS